jgi:thiamine transporter
VNRNCLRGAERIRLRSRKIRALTREPDTDDTGVGKRRKTLPKSRIASVFAMRRLFLGGISMKKKLRSLCEGAAMVAIAQILSYIKLWQMPWGGSVVLAMVPIILYAVRWGLGSGLIAGFAFGVLQFMFDGGFAIGWESIVGDYLLAFTVLGLAGLMKGKKLGVFWGTLIGGVARFLVHYVVGATIWAAYMPEEFFGLTMTTPWFYSLLYNIAYMGPNIIITLVIFALLYKPMKKYLLGQDIQAA